MLGLLIDPRVGAAGARGRHRPHGANSALGEISGVPGHVPLAGEFTVEALGDGKFTCTGPMFKGFRMDLGPMAVLRRGNVRVVLASKKCQAADQEMFRHVGIEPKQQRMLALKSSVHFRADFQPIAKEVLVVVAPGPGEGRPDDVPLDAAAARAAAEAAADRRSSRLACRQRRMPRRYVIALIKHETNTFSPLPTPLSSFGHGNGPAFGAAARARFENTNTPMAAYLDLARREGAEIVTPVAAEVVAVEQGLARDVRDAGAAARGCGARRLRRGVARPARRDGDRGLRRRRRRDRRGALRRIAPQHADRRHARLPHQPVRRRWSTTRR